MTIGPPRLHLQGVNIVDVNTNDVRAKTSITLLSGRVSAIGEDPPPDAAVLDLDGCWVTPGLVDMHTHITLEPRAHHPGVLFDHAEDPSVAAQRAVRNLGEALRAGICLVRDVGGRGPAIAHTREMARSSRVILPDVVTSGAPLCIAGGHGVEFGQVVPDLPAVLKMLGEHRRSGHEWLKIMNGPELWPADLLRDIVAAAKAEDLRVAIHAFTSDGVRDAVHARPHTIEHAMVRDDDLIAAARRHGIAFVPTYYCSWLSLRPRFTWTQPPHEVAYLEQWRDYLDLCRPAHLASGLPILPGTDAGCAPCTFDDHIEELLTFERWGIPPIQVIRSSSIEAATALRRDSDTGSISVGKWANMLITESDPTESVRSLRSPLLVLFRGADVVNLLGERWN